MPLVRGWKVERIRVLSSLLPARLPLLHSVSLHEEVRALTLLPYLNRPQKRCQRAFLGPLFLLNKMTYQVVSPSLKTELRLLLVQLLTHASQDLIVPDSKETAHLLSNESVLHLAHSQLYTRDFSVGFL